MTTALAVELAAASACHIGFGVGKARLPIRAGRATSNTLGALLGPMIVCEK